MGDIYFPVIFIAGILLILLFAAGFIGLKIRIPGIVLYILLGIALNWKLSGNHLIYLAGEIGIVLLFFMLGMEFPVSRLVGIAKKVAPAGILDIALNLVITVIICIGFGLDIINSFLLGGILYATSSSITAKILEISKRMVNPESEFILGLLIFEDIVAPIAIAIMVALTSGGSFTVFSFGLILLKIGLLIFGAVALGRIIFSRLGGFADRYISHDIFILMIAGIALTYGGLALLLNLSEALGAFLAGIVIAEIRRTENIEHVVLPARDLFLPLFFFYFGSTISLGEGVPMFSMLIALLLWSVIAKIITGYFGGRWYGLSKKAAMRAGLSFTQRGEFSVIIAGISPDPIRIMSGVFIISSALIGILLFEFAPKITKKLFPGKKTPVKYKAPEA